MLLHYLPDRALPPLLLLAGELMSYRYATDTQGDLIAALSLLKRLDEQAWETCGKIRVNFKSCTYVRF